MTTICLTASLVILGIFIIYSMRNLRNVQEWFGTVMVGIFFSSLPLFFSYYYTVSVSGDAFSLRENGIELFAAISRTLYNSIKAVAGGHALGELEKFSVDNFQSESHRNVYLALNYLYLFAGPLFTSGFLVSFMPDALDRLRYHLHLRRNYHIFSQLNENSLQIAESLPGKNTVVFCATKDADKGLIAKAREKGAVLLHGSCEALELPCDLFRNKKLYFYLIDLDEDKNLTSSERLIQLHRGKENVKIAINAFAESGTGIQVVENMEKGEIAVRFIDMTALLCNQLLMQYPLYDLPEGRKDISVMIVGCDKTGMRMLKTISWCGILDGYSLKIRVYDKNAERIRKKFRVQCPEAMEQCDIDFIQVDAETVEFESAVQDPEKGSPDATYVVMAMGDDEKNIDLADRLFRLFRYRNDFGRTPQILVRIRSGTKSGVYLDRENSYLEKRRIRLFGSMNDVYGKNTLFYSMLERLAFAVDLCYLEILPEKDPMSMTDSELKEYLSRPKVMKRRNDFTQNEYNRRSSMATALHIAAKLYSIGILSAGETALSNSHITAFRERIKADKTLVSRLAENEHIRWNNFMRSEGYCQAKEEDFRKFYPLVHASKDKLSKRHLTMVDWEELQKVTDLYNELDWPYQINQNPEVKEEEKTDFIKNDENIIEKIPEILALAIRLEKTGLDKKLYM